MKLNEYIRVAMLNTTLFLETIARDFISMNVCLKTNQTQYNNNRISLKQLQALRYFKC